MSKKIVVTDLDFDKIKSNLKTFLSSQSEFTDYNFEGSALSVMMDVLAYNTHYNALYTNMSVNESFLDSATKRDSVVSRACDLGYVPRSARCSKLVVDVTLTPTTTVVDKPAFLTIPSNSPFKNGSSASSFEFYNTGNIVLAQEGSDYVARDVTLLGGRPMSMSYTFSDTSTRFVIPNQNVDVDTIKVTVFHSATSNTTSEFYKLADSVVQIDSNSKVFWVKEIDNFMYELRFGDGIIGKKLESGNFIVVDYMISFGATSNGIRSVAYFGPTNFVYSVSSEISTEASCTVKSVSYGGADIETVESIKFNAKRSFASQNRAVTADDYSAIVLKYFPDAKSVSVWGGEDNYPPEYGKVFICIAQQNFKKLTNLQRQEIQNFLRSKKVVSVTPVILDSEFIELILTVSVYYNERETARSADDIRVSVMQAIFDYNDTQLEKFDGVFRNSKLTRAIDFSEKSIVNSNISVKMRREITPKYNTFAEYSVNIINPIKPGTLTSTGFYLENDEFLHYVKDDGNGGLIVYHFDDVNDIVDDYVVGTVDYSAGTLSMSELNIVAIDGASLYVIMEPSSKDVVSAMSQIVRVVEELVAVTVVPDKTSIGDMRAGFNYNFT